MKGNQSDFGVKWEKDGKYMKRVITFSSPYLAYPQSKGKRPEPVKIVKLFLDPAYKEPPTTDGSDDEHHGTSRLRLPALKPKPYLQDEIQIRESSMPIHDPSVAYRVNRSVSPPSNPSYYKIASPYYHQPAPPVHKPVPKPVVYSNLSNLNSVNTPVINRSMNNSSSMMMRLKRLPEVRRYYYTICMANNGELVKRLVKSRTWWRDAKELNTKGSKTDWSNLRWMDDDVAWKFDYNRLSEPAPNATSDTYRCMNRLQQAYEITEKDNLLRNLWHYYRRDGEERKIWDFLPLSFSYRIQERVFMRDLQNFSKLFLSLQEKKDLSEIKPIGEVLEKNVNLNIYFDFDKSYTSGNEFVDFQNIDPIEVEKIVKDNPCEFAENNIWMLKACNLNRGKGLELFRSLDELSEYLKIFAKGYDVVEFANMDYNDDDEISPTKKALLHKDEPRKVPLVYKNTDFNTRIKGFVIQKYIEKPLLFHDRKFDVRVFVLYTHERELFVFDDAYVRLSSLPYDAQKMNYMIHLTNNAVQVRSNSYGSLIKGNIVSILELEKFILTDQDDPQKSAPAHRPKIQAGYFMEQIRGIVKNVFDATNHIIEKTKRYFNFELFGFDFMIDDQLKVWLLEANSDPSLGESNPYLSLFMQRALNDMFRLTIDKIYPPPEGCAAPLYEFPPFSLEENAWKSVAKYSSS